MERLYIVRCKDSDTGDTAHVGPFRAAHIAQAYVEECVAHHWGEAEFYVEDLWADLEVTS